MFIKSIAAVIETLEEDEIFDEVSLSTARSIAQQLLRDYPIYRYTIRYSSPESHLIRHRCDYLSEKPGGVCELYTTGFSDCKSDTKSVSL